MPVLCPFALFENHNIIYLYSSDVIKQCKYIGMFREFKFYKNFSGKEQYLFLKNGPHIIALLCYFFYEISGKQIPAIDIVVVDPDYRRNGITTFFYEHLLNNFGGLISGNCLNKNPRKNDGSYGLWKKMLEKYDRKLFAAYGSKVEEYSYYKAFKGKNSGRKRLLIWNDSKDF